ncbi:MAG: pyridoxine 5'-phosphate synthase [Alphaproteobacteria bacterium CG11_big_fil_rev_8_21_14_0_20_44_7]|nr:MAG: pyridoxine 5'-phosphate synthase [Alphaproteobacteria bacterium CG11_big_fil_rev_8_21_14_0_20_44_7]
MQEKLRLGVNIDHVATIRNARGGVHPSPINAALIAEKAGADGITAHLREDRRHISDEDIYELIEKIQLPLNLEMAATGEMLQIALKTKPHAACIVPEKRQEVTTEGGLDVVGLKASLREYTSELAKSGIRVSLFIDADKKQIDAAKELAVPVVELHTGAYAHGIAGELDKLQQAAKYCAELGIECHAGHGLTFNNVAQIAVIPQVIELNIGHFLIGEAIFCGLETAIKKMRGFMDEARGL